MSKKQKEVIESNDSLEEVNGFVPVQYKILKLEASYILSCPKKEVAREKGTGTIEFYDVPETPLIDWLLFPHGDNGLVAVGDNILFQKIRDVKRDIINEGKEIVEADERTPNKQQKDAFVKLNKFREEIKQLKREINGNPASEKIEELNKKIFEMEQFLFIPEVINVESKKTEYDKFAKKGFFYAGHKYVRRSAGSGNLKQNTVTFVREDLEKRLRKKIRVNFQIDIETSEVLAPSKFGAYEGLTTSGCIFVTKPRVVVIPDFEYITFKDKNNREHNVYYITKDKEQNPPEYDADTIVPFYETKRDEDGNVIGAYLNSFDGMGMVDPNFIKEKWKKDLWIDYVPSTFIVRSIGVKGLLVTFPFREFAKRKGYTKILDVRYKGKNPDEVQFVNINDVDVILTESQWKYKNLYRDNQGRLGCNFDYYNNHTEAIWGVQRYAPKVDKDISRFNYQLVQTSNIKKDEDVDRVVEPTEKYLRLLAEGKIEYVMYALLKEAMIQKTETDCDDEELDEFIDSDENESETSDNESLDYEDLKTTILNRAIFKNYELLYDSYVSGQVKKMILSILNRAKCGKLYPEHNSNYQYMISDPYALCQWAFNWFDWMYYGIPETRKQVIKHIPQNTKEETLSGMGLIPANHVYSNYWLKKNVSKVDACRSPMTDIAEHNILNICNEENVPNDIWEEMSTYYRYIDSGIIYSLHDLSVVRHSDSDFDGDMVCTFDSDVFIENAWDVIPTTYDKGVDNMKPKKYNITAAIQSDKDGFGNKVGVYSNLSTSIFAMIPMFGDGEKHSDPNYPEYDCTDKQLQLYKTEKKDRLIIGEEIDSTKTGEKPNLSKDFLFGNYNADDKEDARRYNQQEIEKFAKKLSVRNELIPKYMPYFFISVRANYRDRYNAYKTRMNDICKWYTYESINNFVSGVMHGTRELKTENEKFFWEYFSSHCPLLLTDCLMNKICWRLEIFESELDSIMKEKWKDNEKYVLMSYANEDVKITKAQEKLITEKYNEYISEIKFIYNKNNTDNGRKALYQVGKKDALLYRIRTDLLNGLGVGYTMLFHMLVKTLKKLGKSKYNSINSFIWNVMGDDILEVIPMNSRYLTWDDTKSADEEQGVEILGKNVVFTWREREV